MTLKLELKLVCKDIIKALNIKYGATRMVILIGKYAFKFPTIFRDYYAFKEGLRCNRYEYYIYSTGFAGVECHIQKIKVKEYIAKSYWCSKNGFLQIQERCKPIKQKYCIEYGLFEGNKPPHPYYLIAHDTPNQNFGIDSKGNLKLIDYAT